MQQLISQLRLPSVTFHRPEIATPIPTLERSNPDKPLEQLRILGAEISRQLLALTARRAGFHTRAAILVTAAGVLATVQTGNLATGWQLISIVFSVAAAVIGLVALRPIRTLSPDLSGDLKARLGASVYANEHRIVMDNLFALRDGLKRVDGTAKLLLSGYIVLVAAWFSTLVVAAIPHIKFI